MNDNALLISVTAIMGVLGLGYLFYQHGRPKSEQVYQEEPYEEVQPYVQQKFGGKSKKNKNKKNKKTKKYMK